MYDQLKYAMDVGRPVKESSTTITLSCCFLVYKKNRFISCFLLLLLKTPCYAKILITKVFKSLLLSKDRGLKAGNALIFNCHFDNNSGNFIYCYADLNDHFGSSLGDQTGFFLQIDGFT